MVGVDYIGIGISFFCHDGANNFLLHQRSNSCRDEQGSWDFGGGKIEFGEDFEQSALREIYEEYGCVALLQKQLPPLTFFREHQGLKTHWVSIGFIAQIDPGKATLNEPQSMDRIGWFHIDMLPHPLHSGCKYRLEKHKQLFLPYVNSGAGGVRGRKV